MQPLFRFSRYNSTNRLNVIGLERVLILSHSWQRPDCGKLCAAVAVSFFAATLYGGICSLRLCGRLISVLN